MAPAPTAPTPWTLLLGPGPRLAGLRPALVATAADRLGRAAPPVRAVDDPLALLGEPGGAGRLLIDADAVASEDLGILRRFAAGRPAWELVVTGDEGGARVARGLLGLNGARWRSWPLDVDQLAVMIEPALPDAALPVAAALPDAAAPQAPPLDRRSLRELEQDLEAIEQILAREDAQEPDDEGPRGAAFAPPDPRDLDLTPEEIEAFFESDPVASPAAVATVTAAAPSAAPTWAPPAWYRDQVADLADRAQRLDLALAALHEEPSGPRDLTALARDVASLTQFARTLGFLAAPPRPGVQRIELDTLLEELLAGLAGARADSPRFLFRPDGGAHVRSDKGLLVACFDALLNLADACSGAEDVVRVALEVTHDQVAVVVRFPAGPLAQVPAEEALAPYALHRRVPSIGPNALAAAGRILQGQGGDLAFGEDDDPGLRVLRASLPRAD